MNLSDKQEIQWLERRLREFGDGEKKSKRSCCSNDGLFDAEMVVSLGT